MKAVTIIIKILVPLLSILLLIICVSDLINFFQSPENYFIGSEVVDKSGWTYGNKFTFIMTNAIHIILSVIIIILILRAKNIKYILLLLLLFTCQILLLILL
jgi:hypothetical protein